MRGDGERTRSRPRRSVGTRLRSVWSRIRRRERVPDYPPPEEPPYEPALVAQGPPRRPRPSSAVALEFPPGFRFDDHADHPRRAD